jgi:DNA-binding NarL/FixJ family response regulator
MIKVLIADDHTIVREGLRSLLEGAEDIQVVGEARDGREAIAQAEALRPDVVVMDVAMPGLNGLEATREIRRRFPQTGAHLTMIAIRSTCLVAAGRRQLSAEGLGQRRCWPRFRPFSGRDAEPGGLAP